MFQRARSPQVAWSSPIANWGRNIPARPSCSSFTWLPCWTIGTLASLDPKQFLFFTRTPAGIRAGREFLQRLQERSEHRDKEITLGALQAQLKALRRWGAKEPSVCHGFTTLSWWQTAIVTAWCRARTRATWRSGFRTASSSSIPIPVMVRCSSSMPTSYPGRWYSWGSQRAHLRVRTCVPEMGEGVS